MALILYLNVRNLYGTWKYRIFELNFLVINMSVNLASAHKDETDKLLKIHHKVDGTHEVLSVTHIPVVEERPYLKIEALDIGGNWTPLLDVRLCEEFLKEFNIHPFNGLIRIAMYGHDSLECPNLGAENVLLANKSQ